jgi:hypothetical protein
MWKSAGSGTKDNFFGAVGLEKEAIPIAMSYRKVNQLRNQHKIGIPKFDMGNPG